MTRRDLTKPRPWIPRPYRDLADGICGAWKHAEGDERCEAPATRYYPLHHIPFCDDHGSECANHLRPIKESRRQERKTISPRRRFTILQRDEFRCQLCGRTAEHDLVALEVDHMQPLSKGGTDDEENLWTLCRDCNAGKSDAV